MVQRCKVRKAVLFLRCVRPEGHRGRHRASEKEIRDKLRQLVDRLVKKEIKDATNTE